MAWGSLWDFGAITVVGAGAAFGVSCVAAGLPALGWRTFFEEPAMLLGFVLVGRALEERAKLQASSDLIQLQARPRATRLTHLDAGVSVHADCVCCRCGSMGRSPCSGLVPFCGTTAGVVLSV